MPYTTGSQGAQANCAKYFMENALHTALTAVYTYVEEVVNGAVVVRIYKSTGASNFFGQDWFLLVRRATDAATTVGIGVTEQYNSTTHLCFNYAPGATSGLTPTAQFAITDAGGKAPDNTAIAFFSVGVSTSGFQYWLSVTADRSVIASRVSTTNYSIYVGLYDDLQALAISPFPLMAGALAVASSGSVVNGSATREPNTLTSVANNFRLYQATTSTVTWYYPSFTIITNGLEFYSNKVWLSRGRVLGRTPIGVRGLYRDVWWAELLGVNGDTLSATIDGAAKTLVQMSDGSFAMYFVDTAL